MKLKLWQLLQSVKAKQIENIFDIQIDLNYPSITM